VASHFHGNTSVARAINSSWHHLWVSIHSANCCSDEPQAAIDGLQWTPHHALSLPAHVLGEFSFGIWAPLAWLITIALCFFFLVQFLGVDASGSALTNIDPLEKTRLGGILLFQLVAVSPLFIVGRDFGRWIFLWTASSLTIFFFRLDSDSQVFQIFRKIAARLTRSKLLMQVHPRPWYLLVFGIPACCWSVRRMADSSPIGYYIVKVCHVVFHW
jgi:hypothetical protein